MTHQIASIIQYSIQAKQRLAADEALLEKIGTISVLIANAFRSGHRLYLCGNGGSAADAQHLAAEFSGAFYNRNRPALPAEALHVNTSYLTAVANDYDYDSVYSRLVEGIMQPGDILIGLSTSGNSANVVKAFEAAAAKGITTIALTGESGGALKNCSQYLLNVPANLTPRIQECHLLIGHIICELVEAMVFPTEES